MGKPKKKINPSDIDNLGVIKLAIKSLKAKEADLVKEIKPAMADGEVIETNSFSASLTVKNNRVLDQEQIRARIGQKKYLELAKIGVEDLKKVMGADDIDACTKGFTEVRALEVEPIGEEVVVDGLVQQEIAVASGHKIKQGVHGLVNLQ